MSTTQKRTFFSQKKTAGGLHLGTPLFENTTKSRKNECLSKKDVFFSKKADGGLHLGTPLFENTTKSRKTSQNHKNTQQNHGISYFQATPPQLKLGKGNEGSF